MQDLLHQVVTGLADALGWPARVVRGHRVVSLADNYDRLGYPADVVTRDARYTRYVDERHVLRSHSTAMVPGALRDLARMTDPPASVLLACAGICYRRDAIDWQHTGTPHQLDLWPVTRERTFTEADLTRVIDVVVSAALPGARWRTTPTTHPYTLAGRQIDVWWDGQWIEIGECGLAASTVLTGAGLTDWSGLAMGVGLDRLVMLRKGVPDIRLLRATDPRVAAQMRDLSPYKPVSHLPPVRRDLSLAVGPDTDTSAEALGDRVREALGADADVAETVEVVSTTAYEDLPDTARARLGIRAGQRNVLVRLVLRPLDRTLTDDEANRLRDRVYQALHEGAVAQWASRPPGS
jgi:phenylalanyl-tRNA synthetase alpha chain